jgi:aldose 1-epimerase
MQSFGALEDGREAHLVTLGQQGGLRAEILTYGGILRRLTVPTNGGERDVVLTLPSLDAYVRDTTFQGVIVGRVANRIADSRFEIDGRVHRVTPNEGANHLHGGRLGFGKKLWRVIALESPSRLVLGLRSVDGDEGYPGNLDVTAEFVISGSALTVRFEATCDQPTPVAMTYHPYFNVGGGEHLRIAAERYLPVADSKLIPTGERASVGGTPFDFREGRLVGDAVLSLHPQLELASGYDHCFFLDSMREADAELRSSATGLRLRVLSDQPALQFYGGQHLDDGRTGICLEPGAPPNAVNDPSLASVVLRPGSVYRARIEYRFSSRPGTSRSRSEPPGD